MDNLNRKSMPKTCINDVSEKIFKSEIFTTNTIDPKILNNPKSFIQMKRKEKKLVLESLKEISVYNKDFTLLKDEYLEQSSEAINFKNLYIL